MRSYRDHFQERSSSGHTEAKRAGRTVVLDLVAERALDLRSFRLRAAWRGDHNLQELKAQVALRRASDW